MTKSPARKRPRPALKLTHLSDETGADATEAVQGVTAFAGSPNNVASELSARKGFGCIFKGACEIVSKAAPDIALPFPATGVMHAPDKLVEADTGLSLTEANELRIVTNGLMETLGHVVAQYAKAKGLPMIAMKASGPYAIVKNELVFLDPPQRKADARGVGVEELTDAFRVWAEGLSALAAIVNAEVPEAPTNSEPDDAGEPASDDEAAED